MIDTRPKPNQGLTAITWANKAAMATAEQFSITVRSLNTLLCLYSIQKETNDIVKAGQIYERMSKDGRWLDELIPLHYVDKVELGYNVTNSGEYVVRAFLIRLNRLVNDTKLSKARLTRKKKERLSKYMRVANKKGVKLY